ncbi:lasso peptide biosynthesis B2 protein [Streptomyces sp. ISL-12]|uniref:lasso peptide biosynthesis B2 protein n=1 Tax=Streptomyces sp. ISL-12 TaxID=2819177 RepID=UPI001BE88371|nr:lasso peptide biosynthesis B2 protein [Streptomyces sp. ISL-12]MBT2409625.1 lasso peptide biosynthesis B2 protein [Streptomyces sp. ISL-12]
MLLVPPGVHRAALGDGAVAVLNTANGTWQWMNTATERIWSAALSGTVPELIHQMRAEGVPGDVERIVTATIGQLTQAGLLTGSGRGSAVLPPPMPAVTAPAPPCDQPGLAVRVLARAGLVLALGMMRLPMSIRMRLLDLLRHLPPAPPTLAASAAAAVPRIRPAWWPGRIACMEVSLATVVTIALRGRRAHWVIGSRRMPNEAHAWVWTPAGALGLSGRDADDPRRPWVGVAVTPPIHPNK